MQKPAGAGVHEDAERLLERGNGALGLARRQADGVDELGAGDDTVVDVLRELRVLDERLDRRVRAGLVARLRGGSGGGNGEENMR